MKNAIKLPCSVRADDLDNICQHVVGALSNSRVSFTTFAARKLVTEDLLIPVDGLLDSIVEHLIERLQRVGVDAALVLFDLNGKEAMYLTPAPGDYVDFGDVCRNRCGQQAQYGVHYFDKDKKLGEGIRLRGKRGRELDLSSYHDVEIHKDDVDTFVERVLTYRVAIGNMSEEAGAMYRRHAMASKKFFCVGTRDTLDGDKTLDVAKSLLSDREAKSGEDLIGKLLRLRVGETIHFANAGTLIRLAN